MSWWQVIFLAVLQGLTEFLPISSSGHLAIASRVFFADDAGASFTAVSQIGTELAVLLYFARDIWRIAKAWVNGLVVKEKRDVDYRMGWYVIIGTIPIVICGLLFQDMIRTYVRSLWVVAIALVVFSAVIAAAEFAGRQTRDEEDLRWYDAVLIGLAQTLALIPGVSRSGAAISAGLFLGLNRELAARFGFLLAIPAVLGAGLHELPNAFKPVSEGMSATGPQLLVSVVIAFVVGLAAIAWFLRFLVNHSMYWFVGYRVALGVAVMIMLGTSMWPRHDGDPAAARQIVSNTAHVLAGRSEGVDLDERGREQADALVDRLSSLPIRALVCSPLLRCLRTIEPLSAALGVESGRRRATVRGRLRPVDGPQPRRPGQGAVVEGRAGPAQRRGVPGRGGSRAGAGQGGRRGPRVRQAAGRRAWRRRAVGGVHARRRDQGGGRRRAWGAPRQFPAHRCRPGVDERHPLHADAAVRVARQPHWRRPRIRADGAAR